MLHCDKGNPVILMKDVVCKTREGLVKKKHSCSFIPFKTVLYTHILNIFSTN